MQIRWSDYRGANEELAGQSAVCWAEVERLLRELPLHLKASDQHGIQGNPIFDPKGTNEYLKSVFARSGWLSGIAIPAPLKVFGTDVDFGKDGVIVEVQFSNYPFLPNNIIRSDVFFKTHVEIGGHVPRALIVITKAHMFPASQSTLYYEQAVGQLGAMEENSVFSIPVRLVGLFEDPGTTVPVTWTAYRSARYSRAVDTREERRCEIRPGATARSRSTLQILDS